MRRDEDLFGAVLTVNRLDCWLGEKHGELQIGFNEVKTPFVSKKLISDKIQVVSPLTSGKRWPNTLLFDHNGAASTFFLNCCGILGGK